MIQDEIKLILIGIDKDECESKDGWWETSFGAEFGAKKLEELLQYLQGREKLKIKKLKSKIKELEARITELEWKCDTTTWGV